MTSVLSRGRALGTLLLVLGAQLAAGSATAQEPSTPESSSVEAPQAGTAEPVDPPAAGNLAVYLMTMGQGAAIWEHFGHNALVIADPAAGTTIAWNWGLFDFRQSDFVPRFLRGEMMYWMDGFDADALVRAYARQNRTVWLDQLALSQDQARELRAFVRWNAEPENRFYRYDYFVDNCSTRVRDALDRVLGGALQDRFGAAPAGFGYRHETERLTARALPDYLGITLMLGPRGDVARTQWEQMFTPLYLRERLQEVEIRDASGSLVPLVTSRQVAAQGSRPPALPEPPDRILPLLALGLLVGSAAWALGALAAGGGWRRWPMVFAAGGWSLLAGLGGLVLLLVYSTDHVWMFGNENILQLNPLSLVLALAVPFALLGSRGTGRAMRIAWTVAGLAAIGFGAQALPGVDQQNGVIIAMTLPIHIGIAAGLTTLRARRSAE